MSESADWWGDFEFEPGATKRWRIGPLTLWVTRLAKEWQVAWQRGNELDLAIEVAQASDPAPATLERSRYLFEKGTKLSLGVRVADRPVVVRPEMPVVVPGGLHATLFVSTPVWIELSAGELDPPPPGSPPLASLGRSPAGGTRQRFAEIPTWQPSSTWFGENNIRGALYYAERTRARIEREAEPYKARAITSVTINNVEREPLRIDRIALPLPSMSVFRAEHGALCTEHAIVDYVVNQDAPVRVQRSPLPELGKTTLISAARESRETNLVVRALSAALREVLP